MEFLNYPLQNKTKHYKGNSNASHDGGIIKFGCLSFGLLILWWFLLLCLNITESHDIHLREHVMNPFICRIQNQVEVFNQDRVEGGSQNIRVVGHSRHHKGGCASYGSPVYEDHEPHKTTYKRVPEMAGHCATHRRPESLSHSAILQIR